MTNASEASVGFRSRIATRPVSQSTSTSNLRSPDATVMRPPLLPPSGKKRIEPTFSSTRSFCAVKSFSSTLRGSAYSFGSWSTLKRRPATSRTRKVSRRCVSASLRARRRPDASWRAALRSSVVDTPLPKIGMTIADAMPMITSTISNSIIENPRVSITCRAGSGQAAARSPTRDVLVGPSPPSLPSAPSETMS